VDSSALEQSLSKLDAFLSKIPSHSTFLFGDFLSLQDCELLPKLHHLRVAAAALKNFHISAEYCNIWRYLHHGYSNSIFRQTCPPDQEILLHWSDRPDTPSISVEKRHLLTRERPSFSFDVPATAIPAILT